MKNRFSNPSSTHLQLIALPAFNDNYIWLIHNNTHAAVIDPGDAKPVLDYLAQLNLSLAAILITHHHNDHVGGIKDLLAATPACPVYGPKAEQIPYRTVDLVGSENISITPLDLQLLVLSIPGHTKGHIAYFGYSDLKEPFVFCGDTLFSGGCGRLFEGTAAQMMHSLQTLASLPSNTLVCCAHEYTLANLMWALEVEPDNQALQHYFDEVSVLRSNNQPTLPSTIQRELRINPFLRTHIPTVQLSAAQYSSSTARHSTDVFAQLREWKNNA